MDELHIEAGVKTIEDFKRIWLNLSEQGWEFVSTLNTESEGQALIFRRHEVGLGNVGETS
jgi:hypothetical protein